MADFVLSTNPPNPKTSFRLGDWICSSPKCAAHNFGRNLSCIGCGSQRSPDSPSRPTLSSPRFNNPTPPPQLPSSEKPNNHHPLLTPSGRAFANGGKVQNISSDPLNPCIMFWPDNEPFPDQGQIRPSGLLGIAQPPILNTGNRGPISHPGDWVCQKCNYLNWRRRKVCQTCLPYAEGNGDSISAAVQAERIALLSNVLARTRLDVIHLDPSTPAQPSQSLTPPTEPAPLLPSHASINLLRQNEAPLNKSVQRSRSHFALGQQYQQEHYHLQIQRHLTPTPIYQTPLPSSPPRMLTPQHMPQPQLFQHHQQQVQVHRNPSPLPLPLLYSTGPPTSPFLGPNLGIAGYRMRVLSSPAPAAPRDWNANLIPRNSTHAPASARGSISSLGSLDIPQIRIGDNEVKKGDTSASGSELPTPAITSPLLPAFLRDVVNSPCKNASDEKDEVLSGRFIVQSPKSLQGVDLPEVLVRKTPSPVDGAAFPLTSQTPVTNNPAPQPRARNDSGSSTCSTSSSSSSSSSGVSLSATSLSSGECGGCDPTRSVRPPSSSPTITTTASSCPTPPADKAPKSTSSLPFMSFGNAGIWKMDGEESRSLIAPPPPAQPQRLHHGFGHHQMQAPLILPVGVEKGF